MVSTVLFDSQQYMARDVSIRVPILTKARQMPASGQSAVKYMRVKCGFLTNLVWFRQHDDGANTCVRQNGGVHSQPPNGNTCTIEGLDLRWICSESANVLFPDSLSRSGMRGQSVIIQKRASHEPVSLDLAHLHAGIAPCAWEVLDTITSVAHCYVEVHQGRVGIQGMGGYCHGQLFDEAAQWSNAVTPKQTETLDYGTLENVEIHLLWRPPDRREVLIITRS